MTNGIRGRTHHGLATGLIFFLVSFIAFAQTEEIQTGLASFYGKEFHGRKTASGERFSIWGLTAAHRTLPFNTLVKVTNLANHKSVIVRINDAGPFREDRIIDLSRAAAAKLGMMQTGTAKVKLEVVGSESGNNDAAGMGGDFFKISSERRKPVGFAIQVSAFSNLDNMFRTLKSLEEKGIDDLYVQSATVAGEQVHRVLIAGFTSRESAGDYLEKLKQKGVKGFLFQIR